MRRMLIAIAVFSWVVAGCGEDNGGAAATRSVSIAEVMHGVALWVSMPWFAASVRDIRMLRIEEFNDLMPAVQQAAEAP